MQNRKLPKVVGIVGFISSGKDTVASTLIKHFGYHKDSFASPLKDSCSKIFNWDRNLLEGNSEYSREWREKEDKFWAKRIKTIKPLTPRKVLQFFGTEVMRNNLDNNIWVASLERRLIDSKNNIVITDCRFPNEIKMIKDYEGLIIRVRRGPEPHWFHIAAKAMRGDCNSLQLIRQLGIHPSEYSWTNAEPDRIIENDGSLEDLEEKTVETIKNLTKKK